MRTVLLFMIFAVALVLQATIFDFFRIFGVKPDLVLLLVIFYGFIYGSKEGAFVGFLGGLLVDFLTGHYIGVNALSKMAAGFFAGLGETKLYKENVFIATIVSMTGTAAGQSVYYLLLLAAGIKIPFFLGLFQVIIPVALYNGLLTLVLYGRFYRSSTSGILKMREI
ncbi:MAG: rod shape-determining protein MreD [Desulfotomaculum sp.]|nr:rod shape-determining protein MreD [Desulfotomaculum sp.]